MLPIDEIEIQSEVPDENPWFSIWFSPKQTAEYLLSGSTSTFTTYLLIYLGGVAFGVNQAELKVLGNVKESSDIFLNVLVFSGIGGLLSYNILIWAVDFVALSFNGKGGFKNTQTMFAWAFVPTIVSLFFKLLMYLFIGDEMFSGRRTIHTEFDGIIYTAYAGLIWILEIWHIILLILLIGYAQKISFGNSFLCLIGGFLLLVIPLLILFFGIPALF